jgi:hypothetical protein
LPPPTQNKTQLQKSFADLSYANTINLGTTYKPHQYKRKYQETTWDTNLTTDSQNEGELCAGLYGSVVWVGVVVLSDRLQGFAERIVCSDGDVEASMRFGRISSNVSDRTIAVTGRGWACQGAHSVQFWGLRWQRQGCARGTLRAVITGFLRYHFLWGRGEVGSISNASSFGFFEVV